MSSIAFPGDTIRLYCNACQSEYDLTLEPKINEIDNPERAEKERKALAHKAAGTCPFCGLQDLEAV